MISNKKLQSVEIVSQQSEGQVRNWATRGKVLKSYNFIKHIQNEKIVIIQPYFIYYYVEKVKTTT